MGGLAMIRFITDRPFGNLFQLASKLGLSPVIERFGSVISSQRLARFGSLKMKAWFSVILGLSPGRTDLPVRLVRVGAKERLHLRALIAVDIVVMPHEH